MIKTIIADDENHARERLRQLLDRFGIFDIVAEAVDGTQALQLIIELKPEVAFLDINMPGISVFQTITSLQNPPLIVFQTAYSEHAATAFEINALDYLLKPLRFERLEQTVTKIKQQLSSQTPASPVNMDQHQKSADQVTITINGKTKVIQSNDIIRISIEESFCYLYTVNEKLISDKFLNYYEEKLKGTNFFRSSRTDIINLKYINVINKLFQGTYTIEMKNGMQIDLSRRRAQELKKLMDF